MNASNEELENKAAVSILSQKHAEARGVHYDSRLMPSLTVADLASPSCPLPPTGE